MLQELAKEERILHYPLYWLEKEATQVERSKYKNTMRNTESLALENRIEEIVANLDFSSFRREDNQQPLGDSNNT